MYAQKLISVPLYKRHQRAYKQRCEKTGKTAKRALQRQRAGPFFFIDVIVNQIIVALFIPAMAIAYSI